MLEISLIIAAVLLGLAGAAGSILPALPGPPLSYAGLLLLHYARGGVFATGLLVVFGALTLLAVVMDYALPAIGAKAYGASRYGVIGSMLGMLAGLVLFALPGMLAGMFAGAVAGEYIAGKKTSEAMRSGTASFLGGIAAMALKLALCLVMLAYIAMNLS